MSTIDPTTFATSTLRASQIRIEGPHFLDPADRVLGLRGANVSASSKVPSDEPRLPLDQHKGASYVGRPFPLEEAEEHWRRLKSWGMNFVRITVTWDAVEHAGPGIYDEEYLTYLRALLESMTGHGIVAYIAIHQDVWSRYCGGSGAPGWTLEAAGFDLSDDGEKLVQSGAAFLDGIRGGRLQGERGLWPTGYQKLACATMNTLFWGGETFAPSFVVDYGKGKKVSIQRYLQEAFLNMFERLVDAVGDVQSVMGFELMNEPHPGFIGLSTIHEWNYNTDLHLGHFPSPLQSFSMGSGHPTPNIPIYTRSFPYPTRITSHTTGNPTSTSAWTVSCPWAKEGVWTWSAQKSKPIALQEDYFTKDRKGRPIDFYTDFYFPFVRKWEAVLRRGKGRGKARMIEAVPNEYCPDWPEESRPSNMVYAPHWYDLNALFKKQFGWMTVNVQGLSRGMFVLRGLYFGKGVYANYALQIRTLVDEARKRLGDMPVVVGECGVPMDLNKEEALRTGNWQAQERMMDALISAMESRLVGFNLWAYNPANRDDIGDDWNAENFSWYSAENRTRALQAKGSSSAGEVDAGARLLNVLVRPYAIATSGTPLSHAFSAETTLFTYRFRSALQLTAAADKPPPTSQVTEIFLPSRVYPAGQVEWSLSSGGRMILDHERERAWVWFVDVIPAARQQEVDQGRVRRVDIWVRGRGSDEDVWAWWQWALAVLMVVLGLAAAVWAQRTEWRNDIKVYGRRGDSIFTAITEIMESLW